MKSTPAETFNLNDEATATLTKYGRRHFRQHYRNLGIENEPDDPLTAPLWQFMQIFGDTMYNGNSEVPFEDNVIIIRKRA